MDETILWNYKLRGLKMGKKQYPEGKERCCQKNKNKQKIPKHNNDKKTAKILDKLVFDNTAGLSFVSKDITKHA